MQELVNVVDRIESKVLEMRNELENCKTENAQLKQENQSLASQLEEHKNRLGDLQEQNKVVKIARSVVLDEDDRKEQRKRLNEMVREIDKCIALING